jgi:hypothetical protein
LDTVGDHLDVDAVRPLGGEEAMTFEPDRIKGTRAARVIKTMRAYQEKYPNIEAEDVVTTLRADLMLYCDAVGDNFDQRARV